MFSIIISIYNNAEELIKITLQSILDQSCVDYEIIVVDNYGCYEGCKKPLRSFLFKEVLSLF
jgi:glycosyltransferase involved in cell wall biosynthesis